MGGEKGGSREGRTLGDSLEKCSEHEGEVVARVKPMPERARGERSQAGSKARFLPLGRYPQVHVVAEPVVGVHIPVLEIGAGILGEFDAERVDVLEAVPIDFPRLGVDAAVADAGEDAGAFGQGPDAVVFHAGDEAEHLEVPDAAEEAVGEVGIVEDEGGVVPFVELEEEEDPDETGDEFDGGGEVGLGDFAAFAGLGFDGGVGARGDFEHGCFDPAAVVDVVEGGAGEEGGEEEHIAGEVEEVGELGESVIALEVGHFFRREAPVFDVPAEGGEFHDEDHLHAGDVDQASVVDELAVDVVDGHVAHEEDEADPWHKRAVDVFGNGVCSSRADQDSADACPQIK